MHIFPLVTYNRDEGKTGIVVVAERHRLAQSVCLISLPHVPSLLMFPTQFLSSFFFNSSKRQHWLL